MTFKSVLINVIYRIDFELRGNTMKYRINRDTIILDPNPVLRAKAEEVAFPLQDEDKELLLEMLQYVRDSQDEELSEKYNLQPAVGIAAPQVGVSKQMTAISVEMENKDGELERKEYALINPKIIAHSEKKAALAVGEGCLSIKEDYPGLVPRYQRIRVKAYDLLQEQEVTLRLNNYLAIIFQHEIDHLHGVLFYDYINQKNPWDDENLKIIE